jgi:hypothetical protein
MGFIVSQSIVSDIYGEMPSFYVRIENYRLDKLNGQLFLTTGIYYDADSANILNERSDIESVSIDTYPVNGEVEYNNNVYDMNNLIFHRLILTASYYNVEDIYEELPVSESISYYEYDSDGNMIETTNEELIYKFVKTGEKLIDSVKIDISPVTASLFEFSYSYMKNKFGEVFGNEHIIDC